MSQFRHLPESDMISVPCVH